MGQSLRDKGSAVGPPGPLMFKIDRINEIQIDAHPLRPQQNNNPHQSREEHSAAAAMSPWCPSLFLSGRSAAERAPIAKHLLGLECLPEHLLNQLKQEGTAPLAGPQTAARTSSRFAVVENSLQVTFSSSEAPSPTPSSSSSLATLGNEEGSFPPPPEVWSPFLKRLVVVAAATIELPLSRYPIAPPRCPASGSIDTWDGVAVTVDASDSRGRQQSATRSGKQVDEPKVLREGDGAGPQRPQLRSLHCVLYPVELSSTTTATTTSHSHKNNNNSSSSNSRGGGTAATPRSLPSRQANSSTSSVSSLASSKGSHANQAPITATASPDGGSSSLRQQWLATIHEHENRFHRSLRRVEAELNAATAVVSASPAATSAPIHHNPPQEIPPTTASPAAASATVAIHIGVPVYYLRLPFQDNGSQRMGDALWAEYVQLSSLSSSSPTTSADNFLRTLLSSGSTYAAAAQRPLRVAEYPLFWLLDRLHPSCCSSFSSSSTSAVEGKEEKEKARASEDDDEGGLLWRHNERLATILHRCFLQPPSHKKVVEPALATATTAPPAQKRLPRGAGVLIHCQLGVSRSATIVVAYLLIHFVTYQLGIVVGRRCRRSRTSAAIGDAAVATASPLPTSSTLSNNNNDNRPATEGKVEEAAFAHATATPPPSSWDPLLGHNYAIESSGPVSVQPLPLLSRPDVGEHGDDDATFQDKKTKQEEADLLDVAPPSLARMLALVRAARPRVAPNPCFGAELAKLERCLLPFLL